MVRHDLRDSPGIDVTGDLSEPATIDAIRAIAADVGLTGVVAAHGLAGSGELDTISDDRIAQILTVNTNSVLTLFEAFSSELVANDGTFIAVSSEAGLDGEAQNAVYSASKAALIGWGREIAQANGSPRIRVVCPGMTETPLLTAGLTGMAEGLGISYEEFLSQRLQAVPSGRLGRPEEIARAVVWLSELQTDTCVIAAVTGGEVFE